MPVIEPKVGSHVEVQVFFPTPTTVVRKIGQRVPVRSPPRRSTRASRSLQGGVWLTRRQRDGSMMTAARPGLSGSPGSLPLRPVSGAVVC